MPVVLTYPIYTLTLSSQATSHNSTIFHQIDIRHVGTKSSSASCAMLMRPNKAEAAVHGCSRLSCIFISFFLSFHFIFLFVALVHMPVALTYSIYTSTFTSCICRRHDVNSRKEKKTQLNLNYSKPSCK